MKTLLPSPLAGSLLKGTDQHYLTGRVIVGLQILHALSIYTNMPSLNTNTYEACLHVNWSL